MMSEGREHKGIVRWPLIVATGLMIAGLALSYHLAQVYLDTHYGLESFESRCDWSEGMSCGAVAESRWATVLGIPNAVLAAATYVFLAVLFAWTARASAERRRVLGGYLLAIMAGVLAYSLFLLAVSTFSIHAFCPFCLGLDLVNVGATVALLAAFRWRWRDLLGGLRDGVVRPSRPAAVAVILLILVAGVAIGAERVARQRLIEASVAAALGQDQAPAAPPAGKTVAAPAGEGGSPAGAADPVRLTPASEAPSKVTKPIRGPRRLPPSREQVPLRDDDPSLGPPDAPITIVTFGDFDCGYCKKFHSHVEQVRQRHPDEIRVISLQFPMHTDCNPHIGKSLHRSACMTSKAALCAHEQGRYWEFHEELFKNRRRHGPADIDHYARHLGLDTAAFSSCMDSERITERLAADVTRAGDLGVTGTPRSYINGRVFSGAVAPEVIEAVVQVELGNEQIEPGGDFSVLVEKVAASTNEPDTEGVPALTPGVVLEMIPITKGGLRFLIDPVEASVDTEGRAVPVAGVDPAHATWYEARDACARSGKRLCTQQEWITACQGAQALDDDRNGDFADDYVEGREYPYGDYLDAGICHVDGDRDQTVPLPAGGLPGCRTPEGVHDLVGNLQEWVGSDGARATLMGGTFYSKSNASCLYSYDTFGPGLSNRSTGFRCCADTPAGTTAKRDGR